MAPTPVATYFVKSATQGTAALTTPSFTPGAGEIIVVKLATWDTNTAMQAPTGGGLTYTAQSIDAPGGFKPWLGIYTATVASSPGAMTISSAPAASARYSMIVERWSGAALAASPVVVTAVGSGTAPSATMTTSADSSVISWVSGDENSVDPSTRAYLLSAVDEGVRDDHIGTNGVDYHAYAIVGAAGSYTFGLSAPTGQAWSMVGLELLNAAPAGATPAGFDAPVTFGSPTAAEGLTGTPTGFDVPVTFGTPTATVGLSTTPAGFDIPVTFGSPAAAEGLSAIPAGFDVPVSFGTPAASNPLSASPAGFDVAVTFGTPSTVAPVAQPTLITVTGTFPGYTTGIVSFQSTATARYTSGAAIQLPGIWTAPISGGVFTLTLPASNDPAWTPAFTYRVRIRTATSVSVFDCVVPYDVTAATIAISRLVPAGI